MKKAVFDALQGGKIVVEYNEEASCRMCGNPVMAASMGGTDVCPWCDCGCNRDGTKWSYEDFRRAMKHSEKVMAGGQPP